ncbi:MAG: ribonuclease domain-containing protein [Aeromicrobium sp.]|uniref:ribonuclease domain-containing protein n=1 Tax=Aeromicrobium sp. TaxID=1871063 RepID=UPI003C3DC604
MRRVGFFLLLVIVTVGYVAFVEPGSPSATPPASPPRMETSVSPPVSTPPSSAERSLPPEARDTIAAIDAGGPFGYDRDGSVFQNRERRLPAEERGYWREYTVDTPGSSDRGARRLVEGRRGELYYTDDHYRTFRQIRSAGGGA